MLISALVTGAFYFTQLPKNVYANFEKIECEKIEFVYEKNKFVFIANYTNLTEAEKVKRNVYLSMADKLQLVNEIYELGFNRAQAMDYVFCGYNELLNKIQKTINCKPKSAVAQFKNINGRAMFTFTKEQFGRKVDTEALSELFYIKLLSNVSFPIKIPVTLLSPETTQTKLKNETFERGNFTTHCNNENTNRTHNIVLALKSLDGYIIKRGDFMSFNEVVGQRTERRGYKIAAIIANGKYSIGVGGGVCQVSTTLYNAALLSDLTVTERHRHTLKSGYIETGFDAMVSDSGADLKLKNNTNGNIYLICNYNNGEITIRFYGLYNPYKIVRRSVIEEEYPLGSSLSTSYLDYFLDGKTVKDIMLHKDFYYPNHSYEE
ncbi:MAG: VanW family protein [Clostridia bacterium]